MKRINILFLLALLTFSGAIASYSPKYLAARQDERSVSNFKGIATGGPLNVKVTMGNTESIRFEGDKDAIAELVSEVVSGTLTIKPKTKWSDWSRRYSRPQITVYINAKKLNAITMSGSGSIEVSNTISGSDLAATLSGSGNIKATVSVKSFSATISGSGNISLAGKSDDSNLTLSGSGSFGGKNFSVNKASVQISGSADVYIKASQTLDAVISGSGNIHYSGDADVKKTIIGSGSISKS